jgi:hypothetical protein
MPVIASAQRPSSDVVPADVWTIGYANKSGKDDAMRDTGADVVIGTMAKLAELTGGPPSS